VMVLWYFPERKITIILTSYAYMSMSENVEKSVKQCARPLRFPWISPMEPSRPWKQIATVIL